jgi:Fe-S-cluster containining protein
VTTAERLQKIYDELPSIECQRKCQQFCGPLLIPRTEYVNIEKTGAVFELSAVSQVELDRRWAWMDKTKLVATIPIPGTVSCTMLYPNGKCRIYEKRPLVCRGWGLIDVQGMRCPFGCKPSRWVTEKEFRSLMERILAIDRE